MDFLIQLDHLIFNIINQALTGPFLDSFFPFITDLHKQVWFTLSVYPILFGFYIYKFKKLGLFYFLFCLLAVGVSDLSGNRIFKKVVERPRPFQTEGLTVTKRTNAHGASFISNHSANMFAIATYTAAFFPAGRFVFFAVALLIGYSRVYNGVHFPLDVICGALWGIAISLFFIFLARKFAHKFQFNDKVQAI